MLNINDQVVSKLINSQCAQTLKKLESVLIEVEKFCNFIKFPCNVGHHLKKLKIFSLGIQRCRIVGRNPEKNLKSFPPCYSQSPQQLCPEISITSISHNLLRICANAHNLLHIIFQLLYTVKEKAGNPYRQSYPFLYGLRNPYRNLRYEKSQDYAHEPQCWLLDSCLHLVCR